MNRYEITAELLGGESGVLLEAGARDRALARYLDAGRIAYRSADLEGKHDFIVNLEERLPMEDKSFDFVAALDVLEHVENIHGAFAELARITGKKMIISLPNMGALGQRWSFFARGRLRTQKYDLPPEHPGDRHRWLTVRGQTDAFVAAAAAGAGMRLDAVVEEIEGNRLAYMAAKIFGNGLFTARCVYALSRR